MSESDKVFAGSIPELYDTYLVPLIFEAYALDLAKRITATSPTDVLETAAGSAVGGHSKQQGMPCHARWQFCGGVPIVVVRPAACAEPDLERYTIRFPAQDIGGVDGVNG